ncbi:glycoside hydrolase family 26 protein [Streptomyces yaizuensis]|uniref:Beta-mannanase n=1 Tax=Streptomyces yaizuensis TaxID=2989713 RepID=A0ABQ5P0B5_9ACTN|nr:glycosyl hydrolase [Streptomyces sp. YSPA8]GLF96043.1 beta-mannanase [Streptomyces sp. YSPA8]
MSRRSAVQSDAPTGGRSPGRVPDPTRRKKKLHWWNRGTGVRLRLWMAFNMVLLSGLSYGVYLLVQSNSDPAFTGFGRPENRSITDRLLPSNGSPIPSRAELLKPEGRHFGVSTYEAPWSKEEITRVSAAAGTRPTMVEYFVKWTEEFDPEAIDASYRQGMLPVLSWEPWGGEENGGTDQPEYRLSAILAGKHDAYIERFARDVAAHDWPLAIRFAHEMNGEWYPWSEQYNDNKLGEYAKVWRHVHGIFEKAGAGNVIWLWSPNILRPVPDISLEQLYPGKEYVDWVGMVGYAVKEKKAAAVFEPTLKALRKFTDQPIFITETGAQPTPHKHAWTADFFDWLNRTPDISGFIWFERDTEEGGKADWRFTADPRTTEAFQQGIRTVDLVSAGARDSG